MLPPLSDDQRREWAFTRFWENPTDEVLHWFDDLWHPNPARQRLAVRGLWYDEEGLGCPESGSPFVAARLLAAALTDRQPPLRQQIIHAGAGLVHDVLRRFTPSNSVEELLTPMVSLLALLRESADTRLASDHHASLPLWEQLLADADSAVASEAGRVVLAFAAAQESCAFPSSVSDATILSAQRAVANPPVEPFPSWCDRREDPTEMGFDSLQMIPEVDYDEARWMIFNAIRGWSPSQQTRTTRPAELLGSGPSDPEMSDACISLLDGQPHTADDIPIASAVLSQLTNGGFTDELRLVDAIIPYTSSEHEPATQRTAARVITSMQSLGMAYGPSLQRIADIGGTFAVRGMLTELINETSSQRVRHWIAGSPIDEEVTFDQWTPVNVAQVREIVLSFTQHDDLPIRCDALRCLGQLVPDDQQSAVLSRATESADAPVRASAFDGLIESQSFLGGSSCETVRRALNDSSSEVRQIGANHIRHLADEHRLECALRLARGDDPREWLPAALHFQVAAPQKLRLLAEAIPSPEHRDRVLRVTG